MLWVLGIVIWENLLIDGEIGEDTGVLTKEWLNLVASEIIKPEEGLFEFPNKEWSLLEIQNTHENKNNQNIFILQADSLRLLFAII